MKTIGARDKQKRKSRNDKGKRRSIYRGKPTRKKRLHKGNLVYYESRRRKGDPIRVWIWERRRMSSEGYRRWSARMRRYITPTITKFVDSPVEIDPSLISTSDLIGQFVTDFCQYPGKFLLMMPTHSKNSYRVSYKCKARVSITEADDHLRYKVFDFSPMKRYWFWMERK